MTDIKETTENRVINGQTYFITKDKDYTSLEFSTEYDDDFPFSVDVEIGIDNKDCIIESWLIESRDERHESPGHISPSELIYFITDDILLIFGDKKGKEILLNFAKERLAYIKRNSKHLRHEISRLKNLVENIKEF